jgi:hypothetical protein
MNFQRSLIGVSNPLVFLLAFLVFPMAPVAAQTLGTIQGVVEINARPGTVIGADELGVFLAKSITAKFGADMRPLSVNLRLEMISRDKRITGKFESKAVKVEPGKTYNGSKWIAQPQVLNKKLAAPLKPAEFVIFRIGQWTVTDPGRPAIPSQCQDATHAVRILLVSDGRLFWEPNKPIDFICLKVEG